MCLKMNNKQAQSKQFAIKCSKSLKILENGYPLWQLKIILTKNNY